MHKVLSFIRSAPLFLLLLPLFFFLHTLNENYTAVLVKECFLLTGFYFLISLVLYGLFLLLFKEKTKAGLFTIFIMAFNFFFGSVHDFLLNNIGRIFILKYSFIVPVVAIGLILLFIGLKRTKKKFPRAIYFFNTVLLLLLAWEVYLFSSNSINEKPIHTAALADQLTVCDSCAKPDIYLIVADEYAGGKELKEYFSFDNSVFENALTERGFHVSQNTTSNYNATVYSIASALNMGYLEALPSDLITHKDMFRCQELIKENTFTEYLLKNNYSITNHSFFDLASKEKLVSIPFFPKKQDIFLTQTFIGSLKRDLGFRFATAEKIDKVRSVHLVNNTIIDSVAKQDRTDPSGKPKFVYTHLAMPHNPYFFDSLGNKIPTDKLTDAFKYEKEPYVQYLVYANKKLLGLIDHILAKSAKPPIIILISDHGFRQFDEPAKFKPYYFMTLNAVYFPDKNYTNLYDGMSNVNLFRVILNAQFRQRLPLLKDSTSFMVEPELKL